MFDLAELLEGSDRACAYADALWEDLPKEEIRWRPRPDFSPIGWHLGHHDLPSRPASLRVNEIDGYTVMVP